MLASKQAKKEVRTLVARYTNERLRLASFLFIEAWVLRNDSNTWTCSSVLGYALHRPRKQTSKLLTLYQVRGMGSEGMFECMP